MELRKWLRERIMVNMRSLITIEEKVGECETDLSCRMVTASRSGKGLVVRVEDGTCSQVVSVEYRCQDDVWLRKSILLDRMMEQKMVPRA